jgi:hypothetical protein
MTFSAEPIKTIDAYLVALRKQLRDLLEEDVNDIVDEIRGHILDKTSGAVALESVAATLAALGPPEELASRYRTEEMLKRAQLARSPGFMFRSLLRWATVSVAGLLVFVISVAGYCLGGWLVVFGALKVISPRGTGLWWTAYADGTHSLGMGSGNQPPGNAHDILGWWLVPIGLLIGGGLLVLTFRFDVWSVRKFSRPRGWRQDVHATRES